MAHAPSMGELLYAVRLGCQGPAVYPLLRNFSDCVLRGMSPIPCAACAVALLLCAHRALQAERGQAMRRHSAALPLRLRRYADLPLQLLDLPPGAQASDAAPQHRRLQ